MSLEKTICTEVQENIAWGRNLSSVDQIHILTCSKCQLVALEFEEIDSVLKNNTVEIPEGFADSVMQNLLKHEHSQREEFKIIEFCTQIFNNPVFRWGVGGTSFLLAFAAH
jgi:Zn-finger nucleic acid-binding protein